MLGLHEHRSAFPRLHGPAEPRTPLVLDSPHSGFDFPADFGAAVSEFELRDGEDCFVDELWLPATERGVGLIAARAPRTYIDCNRHAGDIDLALVEGGAWPDEHVPSGKARLGKALIWRTLDDGREIYAASSASTRSASASSATTGRITGPCGSASRRPTRASARAGTSTATR